MIELDVDMEYCLDADMLGCIILHDENGEMDDMVFVPERTCRMTQYGPEYVLAGWWRCSECEGPVYPPCNEEIAVWALQQCPRCGAKVEQAKEAK